MEPAPDPPASSPGRRRLWAESIAQRLLWPCAGAMVVLCLIGFSRNGQSVFAVPISLLIDEAHAWWYDVILISTLAGVAVYACGLWARARTADLMQMLGLFSVIALLLFIDNHVQPWHDLMAYTALGMATCYASGIALRYPSPLTIMPAIVALFAFATDVDAPLAAEGMVEGVVIAAVVLLALLDVYGPWRVFCYPRRWFPEQPPPLTGVRTAVWWSVGCVLIGGLTDVAHPDALGGSALLAVNGAGGFLAWRRPRRLLMRIVILVAALAAAIAVLAIRGHLQVDAAGTLHAVSAVAVFFLLVALVEAVALAWPSTRSFGGLLIALWRGHRRTLARTLAVAAAAFVALQVVAFSLHAGGMRRLDAVRASIVAQGGTVDPAAAWGATRMLDRGLQNRAWLLLDPWHTSSPAPHAPHYIENMSSRAWSLFEAGATARLSAEDRVGLQDAQVITLPWEQLIGTRHVILSVAGWRAQSGPSALRHGIHLRIAMLELRLLAAYWSIRAVDGGPTGTLAQFDALLDTYPTPCLFVDAMTATQLAAARDNAYLAATIRGQMPAHTLTRWLQEPCTAMDVRFTSAARLERLLEWTAPQDWAVPWNALDLDWATLPHEVARVQAALYHFETHPDGWIPMGAPRGRRFLHGESTQLVPLWNETLRWAAESLSKAHQHHRLERLAAILVARWRAGQPLPADDAAWHVIAALSPNSAADASAFSYQRLSPSRFDLLPVARDPTAAWVVQRQGPVHVSAGGVAIDCASIPQVALAP